MLVILIYKLNCFPPPTLELQILLDLLLVYKDNKLLHIMKRWNVIPEALDLIESNEKTKEGRIGYWNNREIEVDDEVSVSSHASSRSLIIKITDKIEYPPGTMFGDVITEENYKSLVPIASSPDEAVSIYDRLCPLEKQKRFGVLLFDIAYIG